MRLQKLHLLNFKNYEEAQLDLEGTIHCLLGKNGSGKTNLLEAIHYLSFTKGSFHTNDSANVRQGQEQFKIEGLFEKNGKPYEITCSFSGERKKVVTENGKEYGRFSEHIGKYPLVLVAPNDIELIWDGGEVRRKFFDTLPSQVDKEYLAHLIIYKSHLRQRNGLLKMFAERGAVDMDLLESYDDKLVTSGVGIFQKRTEFLKEYLPLLMKHYAFLVKDQPELAAISYATELSTLDFREELRLRLERDKALGRTTVGVHRDDFHFTLSDNELKKFGSQGQQKSFLISLKLAEFDYFFLKHGIKPMILLDDIFDKLDDERIHQLMKLVTDGTFGQIFITDARPGRSLEVLAEAGVNSQNFRVEGGRFEDPVGEHLGV